MAERQEPSRATSKTELVNRTLEDMKSLVKAEVLQAKDDFRGELRAAGASAVFLGASAFLGISGFAVLCVSLGLSMTGLKARGTLLIGGALLAGSAACAGEAWLALPRQAIEKAGAQLRQGVASAAEQIT